MPSQSLLVCLAGPSVGIMANSPTDGASTGVAPNAAAYDDAAAVPGTEKPGVPCSDECGVGGARIDNQTENPAGKAHTGGGVDCAEKASEVTPEPIAMSASSLISSAAPADADATSSKSSIKKPAVRRSASRRKVTSIPQDPPPRLASEPDAAMTPAPQVLDDNEFKVSPQPAFLDDAAREFDVLRQKQIFQLSKRVKALEEQRDVLRDQLDGAQSLVALLRTEVKRLKQGTSKAVRDMKAANKKLLSAEAKVEEAAELRAELDESHDALNDARRSIKDLEGRLVNQDKLKAQLKSSRNKEKEKQESAMNYRNKNTELRKEIATHKTEVDKLKHQLKLAKSKVAGYEKEDAATKKREHDLALMEKRLELKRLEEGSKQESQENAMKLKLLELEEKRKSKTEEVELKMYSKDMEVQWKQKAEEEKVNSRKGRMREAIDGGGSSFSGSGVLMSSYDQWKDRKRQEMGENNNPTTGNLGATTGLFGDVANRAAASGQMAAVGLQPQQQLPQQQQQQQAINMLIPGLFGMMTALGMGQYPPFAGQQQQMGPIVGQQQQFMGSARQQQQLGRDGQQQYMTPAGQQQQSGPTGQQQYMTPAGQQQQLRPAGQQQQFDESSSTNVPATAESEE